MISIARASTPRDRALIVAAIGVLAIGVTPYQRALAASPAARCAAAKLSSAGAGARCRLAAEASALRAARTADVGRCDLRLTRRWASAEVAGGGACPTLGDGAAVRSFIAQHTDDLTRALSGSPLADCPGTLAACRVELASCRAACPAPTSTTLLESGQVACFDDAGFPIPCAGTGQDGELRMGLARTYVDNGDGTISDPQTGLMWEKLSDDDSVHDRDHTYRWEDAFGKVAALNAGAFAGQVDWRLPSIGELLSLTSYDRENPAIPAAFIVPDCTPSCTVLTCSCTRAAAYWTSTSGEGVSTGAAWGVDFLAGGWALGDKQGLRHVRAVRGGF